MELPKRKIIRLSEYDYSQNGYYFITICTQDRKCILGNIVGSPVGAIHESPEIHEKTIMKLNEMGIIVQNVWQSLIKRFPVCLDVFQIMPNHLHGIIIIKNELRNERAIRESPLRNKRSLLSQIIGYFKMNSTKQIHELKNYQNFSVWQRNYYEHIVRNEIELNEIRKYIEINPLTWNRDRNNLI